MAFVGPNYKLVQNARTTCQTRVDISKEADRQVITRRTTLSIEWLCKHRIGYQKKPLRKRTLGTHYVMLCQKRDYELLGHNHYLPPTLMQI